jgi:hypothetical protein
LFFQSKQYFSLTTNQSTVFFNRLVSAAEQGNHHPVGRGAPRPPRSKASRLVWRRPRTSHKHNPAAPTRGPIIIIIITRAGTDPRGHDPSPAPLPVPGAELLPRAGPGDRRILCTALRLNCPLLPGQSPHPDRRVAGGAGAVRTRLRAGVHARRAAPCEPWPQRLNRTRLGRLGGAGPAWTVGAELDHPAAVVLLAGTRRA